MDYRLHGVYYLAPDQGSPDGAWQPFELTFKAENDSAACKLFKIHLAEAYPGRDLLNDFRNLSLIRFEEVDLAPILA